MRLFTSFFFRQVSGNSSQMGLGLGVPKLTRTSAEGFPLDVNPGEEAKNQGREEGRSDDSVVAEKVFQEG